MGSLIKYVRIHTYIVNNIFRNNVYVNTYVTYFMLFVFT